MCTIVLLHRLHPDYPLVVAANRDELYARASGPAELLGPSPRAVGGNDVQGGGTWLGANEAGLFVGLTNQRTHALPDRSLRSRGLVAREALRCCSVAAVSELVGALDPRAYNPFNLVYGDGARLFVAYARHEDERIEPAPLGPGLHVLANDRLGSPEFPKTRRAAARVRALVERPTPPGWTELAAGLGQIMADHARPEPDDVPAPPPGSLLTRELAHELQALCIHTPAYGTRSSTILAVVPGSVRHYLFAAGPPCSAPYREIATLLAG
ncbi:MAG: NRDE family protein [Deltaproteobacteria bacterium]|nr:NRDE family protein [Deltaproteobacteria bacterium]